MQYLTHQWIWKILTFHLNLLILKLLGSKSDAFLLVYSQGLTVIALPPDHPDRPDCSTDRKLGKYFLNPRKKDTDQDEIEEKLIPVKVTVPDEPVRKVSSWLIHMTHAYDSYIWLISNACFIGMSHLFESYNETSKSREDAADVVANVLSRSLTLDDEDVEIDIDVSESRIDDVGKVSKSFLSFPLR